MSGTKGNKQYCLELDETEAPTVRTGRLIDVIDDLVDGKPNAADDLLKFIDSGTITPYGYMRIIKMCEEHRKKEKQ